MSDAPAQDRFDKMLEQANEQDTTIEERAEQLAEQRLTLEEIEQTLCDARRKREARYKQAVQRLENGGDTPEVLSHDD